MRCEQARAGNALAQESHKALVTERRGEKVSYQSSGLPFVQPVIVLVAASIVSTYLREQPRWLHRLRVKPREEGLRLARSHARYAERMPADKEGRFACHRVDLHDRPAVGSVVAPHIVVQGHQLALPAGWPLAS